MPPNANLIKSQNFFKKPSKYTAWKIFELFIIGLLAGSIMWTINFLYEYAYITLDNAQAIVILNSGTNLNAIDTKSFNAAKTAIQLKNNLPEIDNKIRNIFYYGNENPIGNNPTSIKK